MDSEKAAYNLQVFTMGVWSATTFLCERNPCFYCFCDKIESLCDAFDSLPPWLSYIFATSFFNKISFTNSKSQFNENFFFQHHHPTFS